MTPDRLEKMLRELPAPPSTEAPDGSRYEWVVYDCKVDLSEQGLGASFEGFGLALEWPGAKGREGGGGCEEAEGAPVRDDDLGGTHVQVAPVAVQGRRRAGPVRVRNDGHAGPPGQGGLHRHDRRRARPRRRLPARAPRPAGARGPQHAGGDVRGVRSRRLGGARRRGGPARPACRDGHGEARAQRLRQAGARAGTRGHAEVRRPPPRPLVDAREPGPGGRGAHDAAARGVHGRAHASKPGHDHRLRRAGRRGRALGGADWCCLRARQSTPSRAIRGRGTGARPTRMRTTWS